jgi:RNA polymerase sigma factor (sigma-70 family)
MRRAVARKTLHRQYPMWEMDDAEQVASISCLRHAAGCREVMAVPAWFATVSYRDCLRERCAYHAGFVLPREPSDDRAILDPEEPAEDCACVPSAEGAVIQSDENARLRAAVARLPEALRQTIIRRYGLDGEPPATLRQLASEAGIALGTIAVRERQALKLLRDGL